MSAGFYEKVYEQVARIPRGKVASYGQIARLCGKPRHARFVGYALRVNPRPGTGPDSIPCHRVIFKDGELCKGFIFGGPDEQREMLAAEGVAFTEDGKVDMSACQWRPGVDGGGSSDASEDAFPTAPPADFDWAAELGEE